MKFLKANQPILLFVILSAIWGSSFILMKRGLESFHFTEVGALRLMCAFWFMVIIAFPRFKKLQKKDIYPLFIVGMLGNGIPYMLFPMAVSKIDSSVVGVVNSMVPLFTLLVGFLFFKSGIKKLQVFGIVIGFLGAIVLMNPFGASLGPYWYYMFYAILASLCYALSINTISTKLAHLDSLAITLLSLMFVGIPATVYVLYSGTLIRAFSEETHLLNLTYIALLGIGGTALAVIMFNHLIKITSPIFSASVTYFIPVVAIFWGWIDGENIGLNTLAGIACILLGVYLVNLARRQNKAAI